MGILGLRDHLNVPYYERRGITADTALRSARYFRNAASFWMNLQSR